MLEARGEERGGLGVARGKEQAASECQSDGKRIPEDNVQEGESRGAGDDHHPFAGKEYGVPLEEEGAVENALGVDREHRVCHHDDGPEDRITADEAPFECGREAVDTEPEEHGYDAKDGQDRSQVWDER